MSLMPTVREGRVRKISVSLWPAWSIKKVPGQVELHNRETMSLRKQNKTKPTRQPDKQLQPVNIGWAWIIWYNLCPPSSQGPMEDQSASRPLEQAGFKCVVFLGEAEGLDR